MKLLDANGTAIRRTAGFVPQWVALDEGSGASAVAWQVTPEAEVPVEFCADADSRPRP
jgi:hypothetical protein